MITINTFMKSNEGFTPIAQFGGPVPDVDYIEGALTIDANGVSIIGVEACDYIDQLWCYIIDALPEIHAGELCRIYLPDQPISIEFQPLSGRKTLLKVSIPGKEGASCVVDRQELVDQFKRAGSAFLLKMMDIVPELSDHWEQTKRQLDEVSC